ncbi:MAG TPA: glycosyltransferase family 2 protein [Lacibacter sp.]|nr:glycosyltransferase family 2 protein [Lacibacter sp.]
MKVSGFTFVRNAVKYDYPIVESIQSLLPLVDEYVVCIGNSDDATHSLIESINSPKIKIIHSVWDDSLREGGQVLAVETNKAKAALAADSNWLFYLQGDECIHEQDYETIREAMQRYKEDQRVEGLLFRYHHFYGSYKFIGDSRRWYNREIRIIRNNPSITSWKDAQGFRKGEEKLRVKPVDAFIYHYGWAKDPKLQQAKQQDFSKLWIKDDSVVQNIRNFYKSWGENFNYNHDIDSLTLFRGTHPSVMKQRVANENWNFEFDVHRKHFSGFKNRFLYTLEKITGRRFFEYRNYKLI